MWDQPVGRLAARASPSGPGTPTLPERPGLSVLRAPTREGRCRRRAPGQPERAVRERSVPDCGESPVPPGTFPRGVSPPGAAVLGLVTGSSGAGARGERGSWEGRNPAGKGGEAGHEGELQFPALSRKEINPNHEKYIYFLAMEKEGRFWFYHLVGIN